jgi:peptidoglycan/LPS O-acetylase OafA/YrhL
MAGDRVMRESRERLQAIEYLRGIAAFAVMWFHFTYRLPDGFLRTSGLYGYLGVQVFFVISGFIIPYAMDGRGFRIGRDGLAFVGRRIVRLEPPYLMSIVLILSVQQLAALTPWFGDDVTAHDLYRAALHLFYLAPWAGEDWLSPVYWSLAIEFQYYFLVLAAAPLLLYRASLWPQRALFLIAIMLAYASSEPRLVFVYLPVFGFGFVQFLLMRRDMRLGEALVWLLAFGAVLWRQDEPWWLGSTIAIVALNMPWPKRCPPLLFLGTISYSLYLLHGPIGLCVDQVLSFVPNCPPTLELFVQIAAALLLAALFWALVERPSTLLSQRIGRTMPRLSSDAASEQRIAA